MLHLNTTYELIKSFVSFFIFRKNELNFDNLLKGINIEYRTTTINFANYPYTIFVSSKIMEMDSAQQNKVALYLFNSINFEIKNCKSLDNKEQMF